MKEKKIHFCVKDKNEREIQDDNDMVSMGWYSRR
jgi:hypothetical protein